MVTSFDCRIGTDAVLNRTAGIASCASDYGTRELDKALAYIGGVESFEVLPNQLPPRVDCAAAPKVERHPSFWYQFSKTRRCYDAVERYEQASGHCFDWVVRARPDDVWKSRVPPVRSIPSDRVTTGQAWGPMFIELQHWRSSYAAMEDHFLAAPRVLADVAFRAIEKWFDCRPADEYEKLCPPGMLHYDKAKTIMQSECFLGLHLRENNVRWRTDGRFAYMMRRVPPRENKSIAYTRMMATMEHIPGKWDESSGKYTSDVAHDRERVATYEARNRAVDVHRWGEDLGV